MTPSTSTSRSPRPSPPPATARSASTSRPTRVALPRCARGCIAPACSRRAARDGRRAGQRSAPQAHRPRRLPRVPHPARQGRRQAGVGRAARVPRAPVRRRREAGAVARSAAHRRARRVPHRGAVARRVDLRAARRAQRRAADRARPRARLRHHVRRVRRRRGRRAHPRAQLPRHHARARTGNRRAGDAASRAAALAARVRPDAGRLAARRQIASSRCRPTLYNVLYIAAHAQGEDRAARPALRARAGRAAAARARAVGPRHPRHRRAVQGPRRRIVRTWGRNRLDVLRARCRARAVADRRRRRPGPAGDLHRRPRRRDAVARAFGVDRRGVASRHRDVR